MDLEAIYVEFMFSQSRSRLVRMGTPAITPLTVGEKKSVGSA